MRYKFKRRRKHFKTWQIFLILIVFLLAISSSYALFTTQLVINGTATGEQQQLSVIYLNMDNSSSYPDTVGYMGTYSYTFAIPPVIQNITMGGVGLTAGTEYTYEANGTLTIPNVTGNLVIQGDAASQNVNVIFNDNNGNTTIVTVVQGQTVTKPQDPLKTGYGFLGWVDTNDAYFDFSTPIMLDITLYAKWQQEAVAEINGTYYQTLQAAIAAVPTDNTETTIKILTNINENNTIAQGKNIVLDIQSFTLGNSNGGEFLVNYGTLKIMNGKIETSGVSTALTNYSTGKIIITGGELISTGGKSVINNWGGIVEISGNPHLKSATTSNYGGIDRGTIQNYTDGILTITGGTIEDTTGIGVSSIGTLTLGIKADGTPSKTSPVIIGKTYGVKNYDTLNFYDGIIKGGTKAIFETSNSSIDIETGYTVINSTETISGSTYKTAHLGIVKVVTFDANGGTVSETTRDVEKDTEVGALPTPTNGNMIFEGWFTSDSGGTEINANTIITDNITFYAHWGEVYLAEVVGGNKYKTIQEAVAAVPTDNTQTTVKLLKDIIVTQRISISAGQNISFDIQNYTLSATTDMPIIENFGTVLIQNGTIRKSNTQAAVNNKSGGKLYITGGSIIATGTRQAVYNEGGTITISGTANISAASTERAAVQNANGTLNIIGGTITSSGFSAVVNASGKTLNIGTKDGSINTSSPIIQGATYGINNSGTLKFYDGTIKGVTDAISGTISDKETNSQVVKGTETIDGTTYITAHLEV